MALTFYVPHPVDDKSISICLYYCAECGEWHIYDNGRERVFDHDWSHTTLESAAGNIAFEDAWHRDRGDYSWHKTQR